MLHNYLTWRVLERYVQDLSWEYVHANRQLFVDKYGYQNFLGTQKYCFRLAKQYFNIALGALYVETSFDERNKKKVGSLFNHNNHHPIDWSNSCSRPWVCGCHNIIV